MRYIDKVEITPGQHIIPRYFNCKEPCRIVANYSQKVQESIRQNYVVISSVQRKVHREKKDLQEYKFSESSNFQGYGILAHNSAPKKTTMWVVGRMKQEVISGIAKL